MKKSCPDNLLGKSDETVGGRVAVRFPRNPVPGQGIRNWEVDCRTFGYMHMGTGKRDHRISIRVFKKVNLQKRGKQDNRKGPGVIAELSKQKQKRGGKRGGKGRIKSEIQVQEQCHK